MLSEMLSKRVEKEVNREEEDAEIRRTSSQRLIGIWMFFEFN